MPSGTQSRFKSVSAFALAALIVGASAHAESPNEHHFDAPYQCDRSREVTSSGTGEIRTVHYRSVYFPELDWRIALTDVWDEKAGLGGRGVANLYAPNFRYDGVYRDQDGDITSISMSSAWPQEDRTPGVSVRHSKDDDISRCALLDDAQIEFYSFNYLDGLEVMGQ